MMTLRRAPRRGFQGNPFTPAELFRGGVNGVWFDPSDMNTLYQDSTGLIPVTGADQPVGLMLDKSVLTRHEARRNLKFKTESFTNDAKTNVTVVDNSTYFEGRLVGAKIYPVANSTNYSYYTDTDNSNTNSSTKTLSVYLKSAGRNVGWLYIHNAVIYGIVYFDLSDATIQVAPGSKQVSTDIVYISDGWHRVSITFSESPATNFNTGIGVCDTKGSVAVTANGTDGIYFTAMQIELGSTATAYQKVTTGLGDWTPGNHASQATDSKRPMLRTDGRLWWLDYDGIDDVLNVTAAVAPGSSTLVDNRVSALTTTTGVNVTASYALPANDAYGYLIKPPELSIDETAKLTRYFNTKAGR